jgi:hypothetical protein
MRAYVVIAFCALVATVLANTDAVEQVDTATAVVLGDGFYRQLTVAASPSLANLANGTATAIAVAAVGAEYQSPDGGKTGTAHLDICGFKFKNPADQSDGVNNTALAFYFGYVGVSGAWDNSGKTSSLSGALAEIAASWEHIFVYYNNDGVDGFQWKLDGSDAFNCTTGKAQGFDCVDLAGTVDIRKDLVWGGMVVTKVDCPTEYNNPNCSIWSIKTSSTDGVLSFTLRLASQPVLVNNVRIEPNYGKIDVAINYPWATKTTLLDAPNARIGILAFTAGRAGTGKATYQNVDGKKAVNYELNDKSAYFSWDSQAKITGSASTVYADYKSGNAILKLDCGNWFAWKCGWSSVMVFDLQNKVRWFGFWQTEMLIFSWNELHPSALVWDPAIGMTEAAGISIAPAAPLIFAFAAMVAFISNML